MQPKASADQSHLAPSRLDGYNFAMRNNRRTRATVTGCVPMRYPLGIRTLGQTYDHRPYLLLWSSRRWETSIKLDTDLSRIAINNGHSWLSRPIPRTLPSI